MENMVSNWESSNIDDSYNEKDLGFPILTNYSMSCLIWMQLTTIAAILMEEIQIHNVKLMDLYDEF